MTNNPTIDGVSRASIEKALSDAEALRARTSPHIAELRALLDAPMVERKEPAKWSYCPECGSEEIHHEEGVHKQCAECHQEWFSDLDYSGVVRRHLSGAFTDKDSTIAQLQARIAELESEDFPPCDYCGAVPDYHPWHGAGLINGKESPHIHACTECRHKLPSPVSVVLPERMPGIVDADSHEEGRNACLDATAALNTPK